MPGMTEHAPSHDTRQSSPDSHVHDSHAHDSHAHDSRAHSHGHDHVEFTEADWDALAAQTELEGEVLLGFVTSTAQWAMALRGPEDPPVTSVIDIGSGPGVGTCELARLFPLARVVAVDGSPAMLARAAQRAAEQGVGPRVATHQADLPGGLDDLARADVIWASMSLHHVGDEVAALRLLRSKLAPGGLIAIAEMAEPMRVLPDDVDLGRPGLDERVNEASASWFASMRHGLPGSVPSEALPAMLEAAGFEVVGSRLERLRLESPLSEPALRVVLSHLRRTADHLGDRIDADDQAAFAVLTDSDDPRSVLHRPDAFVEASRQIVIARPAADVHQPNDSF